MVAMKDFRAGGVTARASANFSMAAFAAGAGLAVEAWSISYRRRGKGGAAAIPHSPFPPLILRRPQSWPRRMMAPRVSPFPIPRYHPPMILALLAAASLSVIDGDTLRLGDERLRLIGIDAPEIFHPHCADELIAGRAARWRVEGLVLAARIVTIERKGKDRYGRTLARISLDGVDLGATLLAAGDARPWPLRTPWCPSS